MSKEYTIKQIDNGWIMSWEEVVTDEDNQSSLEQMDLCFQDDAGDRYDNEKGEYEALIDLFRELVDMEHPYCKHNKYNISVELEERKDE